MAQQTKLGKGGYGQENIDEKGRYTDETPADKLYQTIFAESNGISKPISNNSSSNIKLKEGVNINDLLAKIENKKKYNNAVWFKNKQTALVESFLHFAPKVAKLWREALTSQEKKACLQHTASPMGNWLLREHNGNLNVSAFNQEQKDHIKNLTSAIQKSALDEDAWLQRGINTTGAINFIRLKDMLKQMSIPVDDFDYQQWAEFKNDTEKLKKMCDLYNQEKPEIFDHGFVSCGTSKNGGFSGTQFVFNIFCPKGTKALYVDPISHFGEGKGDSWDGEITQDMIERKRRDTSGLAENETILQRGTHFRVIKMEFNEKNGKFYVDLETIKQLEEE